jgi:hypothetical protein
MALVAIQADWLRRNRRGLGAARRGEAGTD